MAAGNYNRQVVCRNLLKPTEIPKFVEEFRCISDGCCAAHVRPWLGWRRLPRRCRRQPA